MTLKARRVARLSTRLAARISKELTARGPGLGPLRARFLRMGWLQGTGSQSMKLALLRRTVTADSTEGAMA
jgi:hypothetical protein